MIREARSHRGVIKSNAVVRVEFSEQGLARERARCICALKVTVSDLSVSDVASVRVKNSWLKIARTSGLLKVVHKVRPMGVGEALR